MYSIKGVCLNLFIFKHTRKKIISTLFEDSVCSIEQCVHVIRLFTCKIALHEYANNAPLPFYQSEPTGHVGERLPRRPRVFRLRPIFRRMLSDTIDFFLLALQSMLLQHQD